MKTTNNLALRSRKILLLVLLSIGLFEFLDGQFIEPLDDELLSLITENQSSQVFDIYKSQDSVIEYRYKIEPFELDIQALNLPYVNPHWIGDLNGDGNSDFIYKAKVGDERTEQLDDFIYKTIVFYNTEISGTDHLYYEKSFSRIGDFNGDGYDDVYDAFSAHVYTGSANGLSEDYIELANSGGVSNAVIPVGDVNGDGKDDFVQLFGEYANYILGGTQEFKPFEIEGVSVYRSSQLVLTPYDKDGNGSDEIYCYIDSATINIKILEYDSDNEDFESILDLSIPDYYWLYIPIIFSDFNGDGHLDALSYNFDVIRDGSTQIQAEVLLGQEQYPFFQEEEIDVVLPSVSNKMPFCIGDFNGDGFDDLGQDNLERDGILLYFGKENLETGFDMVSIPLGDGVYSSLVRNMPYGDVNGDGFNDLLLLHQSFDENERIDEYGTSILYGSSEALITQDYIVNQNETAHLVDFEFGVETANLGDINNDGFDDFGVLSFNGCQLNIYFGGSNIDMDADVKIMLSQLPGSITLSLAAGELNGDQHADVVISSQNRISDEGEAYVFFGRNSWPEKLYDNDADLVINKQHVFSKDFGYKMKVVGDYNDDGYNDLVIGNFSIENSERDYIDEAYVFFGGPDFDNQPNIVLKATGQEHIGYFGYRIGAPGDINADGYDDIILSNRGQGAEEYCVYFGGPQADQHPDLVINKPEDWSIHTFGFNLASNTGDFDGDGYNDIALSGVLVSDDDATWFVYKGGPLFDTIPDYILRIEGYTFNYGGASWVYNFTEEGKYDLVIANGFNLYYPNAFVYKGDGESKMRPDMIIKSPNGLEGLGSSYGFAVGNFNQDNKMDLILSQSFDHNYGPDAGLAYFFESPFEIIANSVQEYFDDLSIQIKPNPANNFIEIDLKDIKIVSDFEIKIINFQGQVLLKHEYKDSINPVINVESLKAGVYFIQIIDKESKSIGFSKFVKI